MITLDLVLFFVRHIVKKMIFICNNSW